MTNGGGSGPQDNSADTTAGSGDYTVGDGDCIASIAYSNGLYWKTLWNDGGNASLKQARKSPFILLPGDQVTIPQLQPKQESRASDSRYKFKVKGVPFQLKVKVLQTPDPETDNSKAKISGGGGGPVIFEEPEEKILKPKPTANKPYSTLIDGSKGPSGQTDGNGMVTIPIMPDAQEVVIRIDPGSKQERQINVNLGALDPPDTTTGQAQRLANLGYDVDPAAGDADQLKEALGDFQKSQNLDPTGKSDSSTQDKLKQAHGS